MQSHAEHAVRGWLTDIRSGYRDLKSALGRR
jgi:hypothetical protein